MTHLRNKVPDILKPCIVYEACVWRGTPRREQKDTDMAPDTSHHGTAWPYLPASAQVSPSSQTKAPNELRKTHPVWPVWPGIQSPRVSEGRNHFYSSMQKNINYPKPKFCFLWIFSLIFQLTEKNLRGWGEECVLLGIETTVLTELNPSPFKRFCFETVYCSGWSRTHSVSQTGLGPASCRPYSPNACVIRPCWLTLF